MTPNFKIHTYSEILFSVSNLHYWDNLFVNHLGWNKDFEDSVSPTNLDFWGIDNNMVSQEAVFSFQNLAFGKVRIIEYKGIYQEIIRSGGQTWDVGGILDIDLRVSDINKAYQDFENLGWQGYSPPAEAVMGPFTVQEVLMKGPDGIVFALVHRSNPPHPNPYNLEGCTSNVYLSAMTVNNLAVATDFFVNKLGFKIHNSINFKSPKPERTMFGLPHHLADKTNIKLNIIGPEENRDGLLDLVELEGITGENFVARCTYQNKGIIAYRFPVTNLENYYEYLKSQSVNFLISPKTLQINGLGTSKMFSVQSPDGVILEFYESSIKNNF